MNLFLVVVNKVNWCHAVVFYSIVLRHGRSRATMARTDSSYQRIFVSWLNLDGGRENTRSLVL